MSLKRIYVVFTGGTISMKIDPATGAAVPALSGSEILAYVPGLPREADISVEDYSRLPGPHLTVDSDKPLVFCGAMRTVSELGWDGPANLRLAVRTASHPGAPGRGVLVAIGEEVLSAAEAVKWHSQNLDAFRSPHGPVAIVDRGQVVFVRALSRPPRLVPTHLVVPVDLHLMALGVDDHGIRASLERGARGLVIVGAGCGNVTPAWLSAIHSALDSGVPVLLVSRCPEGRVAPQYGYEGGGQRLQEMGVIFGRNLPPSKARIKLMVALGVTSDLGELRRVFEEA